MMFVIPLVKGEDWSERRPEKMVTDEMMQVVQWNRERDTHS